MAATNYTPIQLYYSTTASATPLAGNLVNGELAINITDGKLYYKDNSGVVKLLASNAATTNVSTISFGTTGLTPSSATSGAVTVAGTLATANGGTNLTSFTSGGAMYATSTSVLTTGTLPITAGGTGLTSFTAGQIHYGSFSTSANLFYDSANTRLGIGTNTPAVTAAFVGTDALLVPKGTTGQQPTGVVGYLRYNTTTNQFEGYSGSSPAWNPVGGASLSNDTSTSSNLYPLFASATSGSATTIYTSNAKLLYKPSTGELQASEVVASNGIFVNSATVSASYTIASGYNGQSVGPVTINSGVAVTVSASQRWLVL